MKPEKWLWTASWWRANLEGWLLALMMLGLLAWVSGYLKEYSIFQGVTLIGAAAPSLVGLRRKPLDGSREGILLRELFQAGAITAGLIGTSLILNIRAGNIEPFIKVPQASDVLIYIVSAAVYLFWRVFRWAWVKWSRLRVTRFAWSLTHAFMILVCGFVIGTVVLLMTLVNFSTTGAVQEGAPWPVTIFAYTVGFLFYVLLASPFALLPALIALLPPMAGASYLVSRRVTRRLGRLEAAAAQLSQGDWSARVQPEGQDEIARLQASFNHMAEELEKTNQALIGQRDRVAGLLKAQRELTASVSHELRTPVATSLAYLENDLDRLDSLPPETLRRDLEITQHEIHRLQSLIDDLFTLSKAEVNQLSLDMQSVTLAPLVEQVVAVSAGPAWEKGRVRVQAELPSGLPPAWADPGRVEQVLRNLLANGVRHTPPGGFVVVNAEATPSGVQLKVTDSGEGIPPEDLAHLFERFYRGQGEPGDGRSGLGLAIVKELVESMGGSVGVESEPDQGSTFWIDLKNVCDTTATNR